MLSSRNGRRQARAALGYAAEFGAYSVGFTLARGALAGFTVYFDGRHAGCSAQRTATPMAALSAMGPIQRASLACYVVMYRLVGRYGHFS